MLNYWNFPAEIVEGPGAAGQLADWVRRLGAARPLIVGDAGVSSLDWFKSLWEQLKADFPAAGLFLEVRPNPGLRDALSGAAAIRAGGHDLVIGLGGGSPMDAAKGMVLALKADPRAFEWSVALDRFPYLADYPRLDLLPLIQIPTTAGSGAELSREAVLVDEERRIKLIVTHRDLLARVVLLDPALQTGLPVGLTAATGMDALTHHIEAYCSPLSQPMCEAIALEGIRLIREALPRAVAQGSDLSARGDMIRASAMAAVAFQKGLGGVHALAHPLGARFGLHHGLLNAVLLPYVLHANRSAIEDRLGRLGAYIGLRDSSFRGVMRWLLDLCREVGIPHTLAALRLKQDESEWVGSAAAGDHSSADTNPLPLTAADYSAIYVRAVRGEGLDAYKL